MAPRRLHKTAPISEFAGGCFELKLFSDCGGFFLTEIIDSHNLKKSKTFSNANEKRKIDQRIKKRRAFAFRFRLLFLSSAGQMMVFA
jgi:hypothetical protein